MQRCLTNSTNIEYFWLGGFLLRDFSHSHIWSGSDGNSTTDLGGIWGVLFIKPQANLPFISGNSRNFPKFSEYRDLGCKYVHENWEKCVSSLRPNDTKRKRWQYACDTFCSTCCIFDLLSDYLDQNLTKGTIPRFLNKAREKSCFCVCVLQASWLSFRFILISQQINFEGYGLTCF